MRETVDLTGNKLTLCEWLAMQEPLSDDDSMPDIEDLPPRPVDCFDGWSDDAQ